MSTPFPLEDAEQQQAPQGTWDPWQGPAQPHWYSGMGFNEDTAYLGPMYRALEAAGSGAAKGEELLGGLYHGTMEGYAALARATGSKYLESDAAKGLEEGSAIEQDAQRRVQQMTPDPATTGAAVQMLHGVVSGAYRMVTGSLAGGPLGGAALLGGSEAVSRFHELTQQGVDTRTAAESAAGTGVLQGAAALIPGGVGSSLFSRVATGVGANVGLGLASRYADHTILDRAGYHDMADQERVWDRGQLMADTLLGAAFGGLAHVHARMLEGTRNLGEASGATDAARVMELAAADRDAAPGIPADPAAAAAHQAALEKASSDLLQGEPVNVAGTGVEDANLLSRPERPSAGLGRDILTNAFQRAGVGDAQQQLADLESALAARLGQRAAPQAPAALSPTDIPRATELTEPQRAIEDRFARALAANYEGMKQQYAALPDTAGGKILSADSARELSPDYLADRTQSEAVHEPASWFIKRMYAERLAQAPGPGEEPLVLFMGGGTGAGKTTAINESLGDIVSRAQIVMDSNMNGFASSIKKIDQALAAGKDVRDVYVYRNPTEALTAGALKRAMRQEGRFGSGRTVPLSAHVDTHVGSNEAVRRIAEHYAGNPHVDVVVVDNSRGRGNAGIIHLENLPRHAHNEVREQTAQALESEFAAGRISAAVYRGFAGREPPERPAEPGTRAPATESARVGAADGGEPQPGRVERNPDELTHEVMTATGRRLQVSPRVVELADLVTSDRPEYPQALQPRQRGARAALTEQVRGIARNLNPELLGNAPEADRGAPITGPGNVVESGNGRAFALREVYANHPEQAQAYRNFLERQGYSTKGMKEPVLVRERVTPLADNERRAFTVEANQTSVAALSPVERAQADSRLLDASAMAQLRSGDLTTVQNAPFIRSFIARLPEGERNALVNPDGTVSQEGVRRLQAAILAKAYGGTPESNAVLGRMLESTDNDMRSTLGAALDAAPAFAKLRQAIEDGKIAPEYDISRALTQAIELNARLRAEGQAVGEFLKQEDFLTRRAPIVDSILKALYDKKGERVAGREKVAQTLMNYADRAIKQRLDQGMLFGDPPMRPEQLLEEKPEPEQAPMRPGSDMFGLRTPQGGKRETGPAAVATQALDRTPNMEIPDASGEAQRARAELMAADEGVAKAEERAPTAIDAAANCAGQRAA